MNIKVRALSCKGPVRENNQDMVCVAGNMLRDGSICLNTDIGEFFYLLIADGMGGQEGGERASAYLLEHLRDCFTMGDFSEEDFPGDFRRSIGYVSSKLNAMATYEGQEQPMGTTLTGVVWFAGRVWLVNVGDSRTCLYRDGMLERLSTDQENEAGLLTSCVGAGLAEPTVVVEDITEIVDEDDILLICSDGLSSVVPDEEMEYFLTISSRPEESLADRAEVNGTTDNVSVIVARLGDGEFGDGDDDEPDDDGRWDWAA